MSIFQESGNFVSFVYLNDIAVAAGGKQVFAVGRDVEVAGMDAGGLITYLCQGPIFRIHGKDGDAVFFQTVAGVEVFPIRTEVDVCTSTGGYGVGCDSLYLFQAAVVVTEGNDFAGQFGDEIGVGSSGCITKRRMRSALKSVAKIYFPSGEKTVQWMWGVACRMASGPVAEP